MCRNVSDVEEFEEFKDFVEHSPKQSIMEKMVRWSPTFGWCDHEYVEMVTITGEWTGTHTGTSSRSAPESDSDDRERWQIEGQVHSVNRPPMKKKTPEGSMAIEPKKEPELPSVPEVEDDVPPLSEEDRAYYQKFLWVLVPRKNWLDEFQN